MCQSEAICEAALFICSLKINETGLMSLRLNILSFELNFMNIRSRFYQWPHPFYGGGRDVDPNEGNHLKQGSRAGWTEQYFSTKRMTRVLGYIGSIRCPAAWEAGKQAGQAWSTQIKSWCTFYLFFYNDERNWNIAEWKLISRGRKCVWFQTIFGIIIDNGKKTQVLHIMSKSLRDTIRSISQMFSVTFCKCLGVKIILSWQMSFTLLSSNAIFYEKFWELLQQWDFSQDRWWKCKLGKQIKLVTDGFNLTRIIGFEMTNFSSPQMDVIFMPNRIIKTSHNIHGVCDHNTILMIRKSNRKTSQFFSMYVRH